MPTKVAICVPARDSVCAQFSFDLAAMIGHTAATRSDITMGQFISLGTTIHTQRTSLIQDALDADADWLLFLDSDMRFPKDTLTRLLAHRRDIVCANYVTRRIPPMPVAKRISDDGKEWMLVATREQDKGLEEVTGCGMGVFLININVLRKMERPWFAILYSTKSHEHFGEDMFFCMKAHDCGFKTLVDHDLSKEVKHVGSFEFGWEHFYATAGAADAA